MAGTVLLIAGLLAGQAADAGSGLGLKVRRLVRQLDASRLAEREEAEQRLVDLGPEVLDLLPAESDPASAEVRQRLGRVRQKLRRALAESVAQPSRVTLSGDGLPLSKILAAFQEQTGNRFAEEDLAPDRAGEPVLSVDFDQAPFWKALDEVLDAAGASIDPYGAQGEIRIDSRSGSVLPRSDRACYSGPFRFEAVRIDAVRDLRNPQGRSLRLTLEVAWEPRLEPITLKQRLADVRAVDENGQVLPVDSRRAEFEVPLRPDSFAVSLAIPMALPSRDVQRIAKLEGSLTAMVPGRVETFRFENLEAAEKVEKRIAGVTVLLDRVRRNNAIWEVLVRVGFDKPGGALASHRNWIYDNEAYLEAPQGRPVPFDAFETTRQTEDEVGMAYLFAVDGPLSGYKFVYKTPGLILSRTIEYQIEDVPLP